MGAPSVVYLVYREWMCCTPAKRDVIGSVMNTDMLHVCAVLSAEMC